LFCLGVIITLVHSCASCLLYFAPFSFFLLFFTDTPPTEIYTLSLHDALPICPVIILLVWETLSQLEWINPLFWPAPSTLWPTARSEEHTSELQSRFDLVCRLLLEKKKKQIKTVAVNIIGILKGKIILNKNTILAIPSK